MAFRRGKKDRVGPDGSPKGSGSVGADVGARGGSRKARHHRRGGRK